MKRTRRSVLKAGVGAATAGALAGCLSGPGESEADNPDGYAAFFALWDWAEQVGGETMTFENPADVGQMGHGWSPDGDLTRDIASSEVFVYLDTPEFSWAQDVADELRRDYDVTVIDGMEGLGPYLLPFDSGELPDPDRGHEFATEDLRLDEYGIYDLRSDEQLGYWHTDHWHGGLPEIPLDEHVPIGVVIEDHEGRVLPLGKEERFQLDARLADGAPEGLVEIESHGDRVEFHGVEEGSTLVVLQLRADGEVVHETDEDPLTANVVEELEEGASEFHDPHVWVDPVLSQRMVDRIADGLTEINPDEADRYRENAADLKARMDDVDRQFEELVENAERDVAVFAGHDSFQYLERRYDFELRTPVGVSPDAAESFEDVADLVEVVEEHDIDTILYDPFEAHDPDEDLPQMVETLLENSSATDHAPLTPAEGTTAEWHDEDWGWIEQMEEVNLPSLRQALDG